jgi:putative hydrolase of the HAD superfamily
LDEQLKSLIMSRFLNFSPTFFEFFLEIDSFFCDLTLFEPKPAKISSRLEPIADIRVILWDIYGTLCGAKVGDLQDSLAQRNAHLAPAQGVIEKFSLGDSLKILGGSCDQSSQEILVDLFHDQIAQSHRRSEGLGIEYPEVEINKIWEQILERCRDAGYQPSLDSLAYKIAYYYDCAFQNMRLYPKIGDCLETLKERGLIQGIISNAQFYTPLRLQRLLRGDLTDFFTEELVFFSYELGCSKPNPLAFRRAIDALKAYNVAPEQVLFIGNDMLNDMAAAQEHGFKTMLFAADETQTKLREDVDRCRHVRPDAIVTHANQIAGLVIDD